VTRLCVHATSVSLNGTGVLIRGPSGAGKSSLALQLLESVGTGLTGEPLRVELISDDQTALVVRDGKLFALPPPTLAGQLEIRGVGIQTVAFVENIPVVLVIDLKPASEIERMPDRHKLSTTILGVKVACFAIDPTHPSAANRLRVAWAASQKL
jgi:HPr kinase/phosphorylase